MTLAPPRPCPRCGVIVAGGGLCTTHQRPSAHARGYTRDWNDYSHRFLLAHPWCGDRGLGAPLTTHSSCAARGLLVPATITDHIRPHHGDRGLMWSAQNHQALCATCHGRKTATEDGGFGHDPRA